MQVNKRRGVCATLQSNNAMNAAAKSRLRDQALLDGVLQHLGRRWSLSPAQTTALARRSWIVGEARAGTLAQRGARLPGVMLVAYGSVKLVLRRAHGEERTVRLLTATQTFGEATALLGKPCPYDAVALTACKLAVIPSAAILELMDSDARFSRRMAVGLAERNHELLAELEAATTMRAAQRLASYLKSLGNADAPDAYTVSLPVSKTLLASRLGMKKETLSRLLKQLASERLIEVSAGDVRVLDPARLAERARAS